jgi:hypothetical protein
MDLYRLLVGDFECENVSFVDLENRVIFAFSAGMTLIRH